MKRVITACIVSAGLYVIFARTVLSQSLSLPIKDIKSSITREDMALAHEEDPEKKALNKRYKFENVTQKADSLSKVRIGFAGDVMLGRLVDEFITPGSFDEVWGDMLSELKSTDFNMVNLETTLTKSTKAIPKIFNFKSHPENVAVLTKGNVQVVNLANNHILDFDYDGMHETIKTLDDAGIKHVGAGENIQEARRPVIIEKKGVKIGILGFTDNEPAWAADEKNPGVNYVNVEQGNCETLLQNIRDLKAAVDYVVVSAHWGPNMQTQPSEKRIECARKMIDAGADIIHGHSAHVFQRVDRYKNKIIIYDAGDFIDDYAVDPYLHNDRSFFFIADIDTDRTDPDPLTLSLIPVTISNMRVNRAD